MIGRHMSVSFGSTNLFQTSFSFVWVSHQYVGVIVFCLKSSKNILPHFHARVFWYTHFGGESFFLTPYMWFSRKCALMCFANIMCIICSTARNFVSRFGPTKCTTFGIMQALALAFKHPYLNRSPLDVVMCHSVFRNPFLGIQLLRKNDASWNI